MMRLFWGLPISPLEQELAQLTESFRSELGPDASRFNWVPSGNYHVTLRFLGMVAEGRVPGLIEEATKCCGALFARNGCEVTLKGLGAFSSWQKARILWAGVEDPSGGLRALAQGFEEMSRSQGFAPETREFSPHVTLARSKRPVRLLPEKMKSHRIEHTVGRIQLDRVILFESRDQKYLPVAAPIPLTPPR